MAALAGRAGHGPAALRLPLTPGRPTRVALSVFFVALVGCGLFGVELWPFSGFKLFSQVRSGAQVRWELVSVSPDTDAERVVDFSALPRGYRQGQHVLPRLARASSERRDAACRAWLAVLTPGSRQIWRDPGVKTLRVYRVRATSPGPGRPFVEQDRLLVFDCGKQAR